MLKRFLALFCVLVSLFQCSCLSFMINYDEEAQSIRNDFNQFYKESTIAYICGGYSIHQHTHKVDLDDLIKRNHLIPANKEYSIHYRSFYFSEDTVYFSINREDILYREYSFLIYKCDLYGNNMQTVYEKNGYSSRPVAAVKDGIFYIDHSVKSNSEGHDYVTQIDSYNPLTGEYKIAIAYGNNCSLEDYYESTPWDILDNKRNYFEILLPGESECIIIDENFMETTVYADNMIKYGYSPHKWGIVDGRVLLVYRLLGQGELGLGHYPHVIFEYDADKHALIYMMIGFWGDDFNFDNFIFLK